MGLLTSLVFGSPATFPRTAPTPPKIAAIDLYATASVLEAEARGEPHKCQCLAMSVLVNRSRAKNTTIQRTSFRGFARKKPSERSVKIAKNFLTSHVQNADFQYFLNPETATDFDWVEATKKDWKVRCGAHVFW